MSYSSILIKPAIGGMTAFVMDKFVLRNSNMQHNMMFAGAVAVGLGLGTLVNTTLNVSQTMLGENKGIMDRAVEVGASAGCGFVLNQYILKNTTYYDDLAKQLGVILVCDIVAEYGDDYLNSRALEYLN